MEQRDRAHPGFDLGPPGGHGFEAGDSPSDLREFETVDLAERSGELVRERPHPRPHSRFIGARSVGLVIEAHRENLGVLGEQITHARERQCSGYQAFHGPSVVLGFSDRVKAMRRGDGATRPPPTRCDRPPRRGYDLLVPDGKRELHELRQQIAQLDAQLLSLLDARAKAARRIGELRRDQPASLPLTDYAAIRELVARSSGEMPEQSLREIFASVFSACLALELPIAVAYAGLEGGPANAAARSRFGQTAALTSVDSAADAIEQVSRKSAEFAVVPFETSTEGPVHITIAALIASELRIVEMLDVTLDLHLFNRSGQIVDVKKIYATPGDRTLCPRSLDALAGKPAVLDVATPLLGCQLAVGDSDTAALATEASGTAFGLEIARRSMLDSMGARARYAIVGKRPSGRTGREETSFVFSVQGAPGSLLDVLRVFAERGIDLRKIQSHPVAGETWNYLFCAEATGHFTDRPLVVAFEEIKRITRFFKLLGSYPAS